MRASEELLGDWYERAVSGGGGERRIGSQEHGAPRDLRFPPDSRCFFLSFRVSFLGRYGSCFHGDALVSARLR